MHLFNKYKDAMYTLIYRITANPNDAEDALQEAFVNVFMKLDTFKGDSTLGAWIKTICVRTALRKNKTNFKYEDITDFDNESEQLIDENMTGEAIEKAILNLDDGYRTVFLLIEVEGYKHKEVAEMLSISEGTSKSQLFHAKKHLQKQLKHIYF
ncbi:MAG: RNA polymerase sigma factor [Salinivirgaceae bacterium]|nr:RNA polymerase sigma factor [Salinivirgaceae bacterium]